MTRWKENRNRKTKANGTPVKWDYIAIFGVIFVIRVLPFIMRDGPLLIGDELSMFLPIATLSGRDWSGIAPELNYRGFGFSILYLPVFWITNHPYIIYWFCMTLGVVAVSAATVIIYHIMREHLHIKQRGYAILATFACSYLSVTEMRYINNEPMITLVCWGLLWLTFLLVEAADNPQKKIKYTVFVFLLLAYASTVHTRLLVLWAAFAGLILIYAVLHKKSLISLKIGIPLGVVCFLASNRLVSFMSHHLWVADETGYLHNSAESTAETMASRITNLLVPEYWNAMLNIVMGNSYTLLFFTCGIMAFVILVFYKLIEARVRKESPFLKEVNTDERVLRKIEAGSILFVVVGLGTIAGLVLQWGSLAAAGQDLGYGADTQATKIFVYIRYYSCYASVLVALFFGFVYHNRGMMKRFIFHACAIFVLVCTYWFCTIFPYIMYSSVGVSVFGAYGLYTTENEITAPRLFLWCGLILVVLFIMVCICYYKEKIYLPIILMLLLVGYRDYYNSAMLLTSGDYKADGGYAFVRELEEQVDFPSTIYMDTVRTPRLAYQFLLNDYTMVPVEEFPQDLESGIVITTTLNEKEQRYGRGYRCIMLDENEYMWVMGEQLQYQLESCGAEFIK